jgi:hypothetical protein
MTINTPRIFGQLKPSLQPNDPPVSLYTVATNTRAQVTIFVCNLSSQIDSFKIALVQSGSGLSDARYIAWETPLVGNGVFSVSGIGLNQGDAIFVRSSNNTLSFTATGVQLS